LDVIFPEEPVDRLLLTLRAGNIFPKLANLDPYIKRYPVLVDYFGENYVPVDVGNFWFRPAD
jgi:hypothetical protein